MQQSERVKTSTVAKILGTDPAYIIYKMKRGELPIGEYEKNGKKASVKIFVGKLAKYLEVDRDVVISKINIIEGCEEMGRGEKGCTNR